MSGLLAHRGLLLGGVSSLNYATWNPADMDPGLTISGGNLTVTRSASGWVSVRATQSKSSGKWYYELYRAAGTDKAQSMYGTMDPVDLLNSYPGNPAAGNVSMGLQPLNTSDMNLYQNGFVGTYSGQADVPIGGGVGIALDLGAGHMWGKALGALGWIGGGSPSAGTSPTRTFPASSPVFPAVGINLSGCACTANFGASSFIESAPSGFNSGWYT